MDLFAPGERIWTTVSNGTVQDGPLSGTSMAAPLVGRGDGGASLAAHELRQRISVARPNAKP